MKKIVSITVSIVLCVLVLVPFSRGLSAQTQAPLKFLVLGDSIAAGYGVNFRDAYASLVAWEMGFELTNYARDGSTSPFLLALLKNELPPEDTTRIREAVAAADIINISIGGNNILFYYDPLTLATEIVSGSYATLDIILAALKADLVAIVAEIRSLNEDCILVLQTIYDNGPWTANQQLPSSVQISKEAWSAMVKRGNAVFYDYHEEYPDAFYLADIYAAFGGEGCNPRLVSNDGIHPNKEGHAVIARTLINLLQTIKLYPDPPEIVTGSLPDGTVGAAYSQALEAQGDGRIAWSLAEGALPEGLTLSPEGVIAGIPNEMGVFSFTVQAENRSGEDVKELSIEVKESPEEEDNDETCPAKYVGLLGRYTKYPSTRCNWLLFILLFGWIWMWF